MEMLEKNKKTLQAEPSRPESNRIQMKVLAIKNNKEATRWDEVAQQQLRQDHIMFPPPQKVLRSNYKGKVGANSRGELLVV